MTQSTVNDYVVFGWAPKWTRVAVVSVFCGLAATLIGMSFMILFGFSTSELTNSATYFVLWPAMTLNAFGLAYTRPILVWSLGAGIVYAAILATYIWAVARPGADPMFWAMALAPLVGFAILGLLLALCRPLFNVPARETPLS